MYDIKIDTVKKLWDELLSMMQTQLDVNAFNTFFLPIIPKEIKNNKFLAEAPTRFVKEVVSSEIFLNKINLCLKKLTNSDLTFEIKEKADFALWITVLQFAILTLKKTEAKALLDVKDLIEKASDKSEYKVENFVSLLKPAEKPVKAKKTVGKTTKKTTETKSETKKAEKKDTAKKAKK